MQCSLGTSLTCLVVQHEEAARQMFASVLDELGFEYELCGDTCEARSKIKEQAFDLYIVEYALPDGSGLDLIEAQSDTDSTSILTSDTDSLASILHSAPDALDDHVARPFKRATLKARISTSIRALRLRRTNTELLGKLQEQSALLERISATDSLTGAYSFHYLRERIGRELSGSSRHRRPLSLALLDVEDFHQLNRQFGHEACDMLLVDIAAAMRGERGYIGSLRLEDTIARSGAAEFAILLPDTNTRAAMALLSRLRDALCKNITIHGQNISIAAGVACFPIDAVDTKELIAAAGIATAAAKEPGCPKLMSYDERLAEAGEQRRNSTRAAARRAQALEQSLSETSDLFSYVYQPIVDVRDKSIMAYEALVRPQHQCFAHPGELFDAAEQTGQMRALNRVLRPLCVQPFLELQSSQRLFINLHPTDLFDPVLLAGEPDLLAHSDRIVFEVTEVAEIQSFERAKESIQILRDMGFGVAVDDFGAGYSGLNHLALLSPDFVKLDMALVRQVDKNPKLARLVSHIIDFANDEEIRVVAEGVETESEYNSVVDLGVDLVQGYYFARPSPPFASLC